MATVENSSATAKASRFRRILGGRTSGGLESAASFSIAEQMSNDEIAERTENARETLHRFVEKYFKSDRKKLQLVDRIVAEGGESLRQLVNDEIDELNDRPDGFEALEVIVATDGSRPSFLIRDDSPDPTSSPLGTWGKLLTDRAEQLKAAIRCVGRIDVPGSGQGFQGTGFLVADDLIITNRHVLQVSARLLNDGSWKFIEGAAIDFGHEFRGQASVNRRALKSVVFCGPQPIAADDVDHRKLDLALIELAPRSQGSAQGVLALDTRNDWADPGAIVCTIGYPGQPASLAYPPSLLELLFQDTYGRKRLAPGAIITGQDADLHTWTIAHDATTLGGNSGSVVILQGREGLAAGLHYGGRRAQPRENWGHMLSRVLDTQDSRSQATLGEILTSRGVSLRNNEAPVPANAEPRPEVGGRATPSTDESPVAQRPIAPFQRPAPQHARPMSWRQGITLDTMQRLSARPGVSRLETVLEAAGDGETNAADLADRRGYNPRFLPGWEIELPMPSRDMRELRRGGSGVELKYQHFSVIMSKERRMPIITACVIDGAESRRLPRITRWSYDGRLDRDDQWGNELYLDNILDRGHMVRREDPIWGALSTARKANVDTFHYTNSCPQVAGVNQVIWLGLEDYILSHTREDDMKVVVFTGPIFTDRDLPYRDALIPRAFWKVVAFLTDDDRPSATAYRVSQKRQLADLEFVFGGYSTFQISIQQVMDVTGIDFSGLVEFDGFSQHERVHGDTVSEELESFDQIRA
jgi:endonuclease G, mitochondrial